VGANACPCPCKACMACGHLIAAEARISANDARRSRRLKRLNHEPVSQPPCTRSRSLAVAARQRDNVAREDAATGRSREARPARWRGSRYSEGLAERRIAAP